MKIANYHVDGSRRLGFVIGDELIDPLEAGGRPEGLF